jgi:hypothetical protein
MPDPCYNRRTPSPPCVSRKHYPRRRSVYRGLPRKRMHQRPRDRARPSGGTRTVRGDCRGSRRGTRPGRVTDGVKHAKTPVVQRFLDQPRSAHATAGKTDKAHTQPVASCCATPDLLRASRGTRLLKGPGFVRFGRPAAAEPASPLNMMGTALRGSSPGRATACAVARPRWCGSGSVG